MTQAPAELAPMAPVVDIDNLRVKLGKRDVLRDITCTLGTSGSGKAIGLLGPNGAGKSTLIRTLLGFHKLDAGAARVLGFECHEEARELKHRIGYMPETDAFVAEQTAVRFVRIMGELSGLPPRVALERAHQVLFHVGLGEARYRQVGTYSVGMKQMAKLAQAIIHSPELVILDEPTNGLDPAARSRMLELVCEMKDEHGMNLLLCSHLLRDVEHVCDEVVILNEGRIVHHADLEAERRANRRFVELEVSGNDDGLAAALADRGADGIGEGHGRWRIVLPEGIDFDVIWRIAAAENLLVRHLSHRRDSLEEIFLKAVGHIDATTAGRWHAGRGVGCQWPFIDRATSVYDGSMTGRWARLMVLPRFAWQQLLGQRTIIAVLVVATFWPLACATFVYVANRADILADFGAELPLILVVDGDFFWIFMNVQSSFGDRAGGACRT